jgi:hypothetical protein
MSYAKVVHPASQNRVDKLDYPFDRLRFKASKDLFELPEDSGAFLHLRHEKRGPLSTEGLNPPELEAKKSEEGVSP